MLTTVGPSLTIECPVVTLIPPSIFLTNINIDLLINRHYITHLYFPHSGMKREPQKLSNSMTTCLFSIPNIIQQRNLFLHLATATFLPIYLSLGEPRGISCSFIRTESHRAITGLHHKMSAYWRHSPSESQRVVEDRTRAVRQCYPCQSFCPSTLISFAHI